MHTYNILEKGKPVNQAKKAIILLHGRGGSAQNIITLADEFCDDTYYIAAPQATNHTWYPHSFLAPTNQNEPWLTSAVETVKKLIDETAEHVGTENIYLMGFSQGACLALEVSSRYAAKYGGVAAFTGGLIGDEIVASRYSGDFSGTRVFLGNSDIDPHVPLQRSLDSKGLMEMLGAIVTLKIYPGMPHTINQDEIEMVQREIFEMDQV